MSEEDIRAAIAATGDKIRAIKTEKPPTMKEDLAPLIAELLALKVSFKEVTGNDFDPPKERKRRKKVQLSSRASGRAQARRSSINLKRRRPRRRPSLRRRRRKAKFRVAVMEKMHQSR